MYYLITINSPKYLIMQLLSQFIVISTIRCRLLCNGRGCSRTCRVMGGGAPPWRGVARLARLLTPRRVLVLAALTVLTLFYCRHYTGRSLLTRPRLHTSLT